MCRACWSGRALASAEGLTIEFREADAEALPFADGTSNAVVSTFGVMFTPDHDQAAAELLRVCKSGGQIGLANWTPGVLLHKCSRRWANTCRFGRPEIACSLGNGLKDDLHALIARLNKANDGTMVVPSEYLEAVIRKR